MRSSRRIEIEERRGPPYYMIIHALQTVTSFKLEIFTITAYTITYSEYFLYKWSTRLQSIYNNMVGRVASVVSPLNSILLEDGFKDFPILLTNLLGTI